MSDTKALCDVVADALDHHGNGKAQDAFEALMGRLKAAESMSELRNVIIGGLEESVKTQFAMRQNASKLCDGLKAELDAEHARAHRAEADNAALLKALHSAYRPHAGECIRFGATGQQVRPCPCGVDALLDSEHPGAALLGELERLRKQVGSLKESVELLRSDRDTAHNAALEEAAKVVQKFRAEWTRVSEQFRTDEYKAKWALSADLIQDVESEIRTLKKTGQGE